MVPLSHKVGAPHDGAEYSTKEERCSDRDHRGRFRASLVAEDDVMGMRKVTGKEQVTVDRDFDVDDRIHDDESAAWKIANIVLDGRMRAKVEYLYSGDAKFVSMAASEINDAFKKADAILAL
jgi:hypothetical protein